MSDRLPSLDEMLPAILKFSADKGYVQKKDVEAAKAHLKKLIAAERLDEQTHTQADIDGNVEYWPNGITVLSQLERIAQLAHQAQAGGEDKG